jgi:hypothetical protein
MVFAFPRSAWPLAFALTATYFLFCLYALFQQERYAWFLRTIGYGGGYPVTVQTKDEQLKERLKGIGTDLVLRTNETLILFDKKGKSYIEVPKEEAVFITYGKDEIRYRKPLVAPRDKE